MNDSRPRSAYVHVPFCRHRCGYCNFTLVADRDELISAFLRAIEIELSWLGEPQPVDTLFFGGGTPTHLPASQLAHLFQLVAKWFPTDATAEISVEANPEDICQERLEVLQQAGVHRVSLGVQSLHDAKLTMLERSHSASDIARCVDLLRPVVRSLSLDLIFGAPEETLEQWQQDVREVIALQPDHVSTYGLTYEKGTSFFARRQRHELSSVSEETELAMFEFAIEELQSAGFDHYEVSNFARPGHRCRHNENYWFCGEFFGVGPGAASFVGGRRQSNYRSTSKYLQRVLAHASPLEEFDELGAIDAAKERLVFGLRRLDGVNLAEFYRHTGKQVHELVGPPLTWLTAEGLLEADDQMIRLTRKGLLVSDSIWPHLL